MKKLICMLSAILLIFGLLYVSVADINHGHGPDPGGEASSAQGAAH